MHPPCNQNPPMMWWRLNNLLSNCTAQKATNKLYTSNENVHVKKLSQSKNRITAEMCTWDHFRKKYKMICRIWLIQYRSLSWMAVIFEQPTAGKKEQSPCLRWSHSKVNCGGCLFGVAVRMNVTVHTDDRRLSPLGRLYLISPPPHLIFYTGDCCDQSHTAVGSPVCGLAAICSHCSLVLVAWTNLFLCTCGLDTHLVIGWAQADGALWQYLV